jgi:hypothetical protein
MIYYPIIHFDVHATGSITCVAKANLIDGETVTIGDGTQAATVFEFDVAGNGVGGTNVQVNVSTDTTAIQVAARLHTAINGVVAGLLVVSTAVGDGTLTLANEGHGEAGNVTITDTVFDPNFAHTGMAGGDEGAGKQSDAIILGFEAPIAIYMPAAWTAADLSFLGSFDGITYGNLEYEGTEVKLTPTAGDVQVLDHFKFKAIRYLKLRSGVAAAEVAQEATRTFTLVSSPVAW